MIAIAPIDFPERKELERLCALVEKRFRVGAKVVDLGLEAKLFFDANRGQYYSTAIVEELDKIRPAEFVKAIAVTAVDLFIPILTFVYGEAALNGPSAVVSSFRLENSFYGLPRDPELLNERLFKESVHELGHTYGLVHCREPFCVMRASTYVEEIDYKQSEFCPSCKAKIGV